MVTLPFKVNSAYLNPGLSLVQGAPLVDEMNLIFSS
jgi:hypothetical protein